MCLLDSIFGGEYDLCLSAWGEGTLAESGLLHMPKPDAILEAFKKKRRRYPRDISLLIDDPRSVGYEYGFTAVDTALLTKFKTLKELILPDTIEKIDVTPELKKIFEKNDTLIRGAFGSYAERLAAENGLRFRPADLVFAQYDSTAPPETTKLTLAFLRDGGVEIKEDVSSPGTSSSNTFGGTFIHPLKKDFCETQTADSVAGMFPPRLAAAIFEDGRLAAFFEKAKTHVYYKGKN